MADATVTVITRPDFPQVFVQAINQQVARVEVYPRPDQAERLRNRKIGSVVGYLHSQYEAAKLLGLPAMVAYYRSSYTQMMEHWAEVSRG